MSLKQLFRVKHKRYCIYLYHDFNIGQTLNDFAATFTDPADCVTWIEQQPNKQQYWILDTTLSKEYSLTAFKRYYA